MQNKHRIKQPISDLDPRIACDFKALFLIKNQAVGFDFLGHQKARSVLSGRHQSQFRGRGLNFEELRHYQKGDDIRTLDWRVTLRTGKPHVRAYTEEKDHQVVLCVDQRRNMFFSSVDTMKSVIAAEIATLCGWRILADNDRIGALVFDDEKQQWFEPQRNQYQIMRLMRHLATSTQHLSSAESLAKSDQTEQPFIKMLQQLVRTNAKNRVYIFISDFHDLTAEAVALIKKIQLHNNVLSVMINDPMEQKLDIDSSLIVSDGQWQLRIESSDTELAQKFTDEFNQTKQNLSDLLKSQKIPLISLDTAGSHIMQFKKALGAR
ncbi:DUF58 domain-containing protein [Thalassotalea atypica]|uniref:DUF58 domain-containing protein n=1 Tax=Thalassotalea atypica TaxID=2054316 RepID=UPI0025742878|nr:DUF58 domain-containing protein [Thalassotalea atypica]